MHRISSLFAWSAVVACGVFSGCGSDGDSSDGAGARGGNAGSSGSGGSSGTLSAGRGGASGAGSGGATGSGGASGRGGASGVGGSAGGAGGSAGDASRPDAPGGCLPQDFECGAPGATCCAGTQCVQATPQPICLIPCQGNSDCATGCCLEYGNIRGKVCAPAAECANCAAPGQACASSRCCQGSLCTTIETSQSCVPECTKAGDCASGCCVPLGNISKSVCLDAKYCPP